MAKTPAAPTKEILEAALQGLESQRQRLDSQIAQVRAMMGNRPGRPSKQNISNDEVKPAAATKATTRKRRVLSPEARKRIAVAQKKRWAAFRKTQV
jgi:hypothetical protein